jgi:glycerol uptake facilitator-like aquaporin
MDPDRERRASAEAVGTLFLVAVVVGSAIAARPVTEQHRRRVADMRLF